jgi:hypothetical protein
MDSGTSALLIINIILNFIQVIDHFITRLKSSKCFLGELTMRESNDKIDIENQVDKNKNINIDIIKQLDEINKFKNDLIDLKNINNKSLTDKK